MHWQNFSGILIWRFERVKWEIDKDFCPLSDCSWSVTIVKARAKQADAHWSGLSLYFAEKYLSLTVIPTEKGSVFPERENHNKNLYTVTPNHKQLTQLKHFPFQSVYGVNISKRKERICWSTFALQDSWRQYWYGGGDSRVLEKLSLFPSEKRSTTIILPQLTKGKRKQTQSFSRKKNTTLPPLKWKSTVVFDWHIVKS